MVFTVEGLHYDEFKSGRMSKKNEIATLNFGTISIFALRLNKSKKKKYVWKRRAAEPDTDF
jgi:hypothetical protein